MATQTQFTDFLKDIEPSSTTKKRAHKAHKDLRSLLVSDSSFKPHHRQTFLSGSYKRDTAIRPKSVAGEEERPDVDIIVVTNHTLDDEPKAVINLLHDTLDDEYEIRKQARSIGVTTTLVDMDVVPIIAPDGLDGVLYIPDQHLQEWLVTNPLRHTTWTTEINESAGFRFKPLVKLVKWWRRENPTISKRPKGFMIECIVAECMSYTETQYEELFLQTFEEIVERYRSNITMGTIPWVRDPGVDANSVLSNVTFDSFEGFYKKVEKHAILGRRAQSAGNTEDGLELWREVFGARFPRSALQKSAELLTSSTIPDISFPDRPIRPNKPRGFA